MIDLLLNNSSTKSLDSNNLSEALNVLKLLKLTELQNFFGDECVQVAGEPVNSEQIAPIDPTAAVVYSVVLNNRTVMILRFPDGTLKSYPIAIEAERLQEETNRLRFTLENIATEEYLTQSQKIYDLLMRPMDADLAAAKASTVVFINDGVLRNVPMAALHDGKQFLVQKYPIANTLSLGLTNRKPAEQHDLEALILGLTVERPPFAALPNVKTETAQVQEITGDTKLLDNNFTLTNLQTQLRKGNYSVVHLATHGKFGVDGTSTYLLSFNDRITLDEIENILRRSKKFNVGKQSLLSGCRL